MQDGTIIKVAGEIPACYTKRNFDARGITINGRKYLVIDAECVPFEHGVRVITGIARGTLIVGIATAFLRFIPKLTKFCPLLMKLEAQRIVPARFMKVMDVFSICIFCIASESILKRNIYIKNLLFSPFSRRARFLIDMTDW